MITYEELTLKLRNPFRLSYGVSETRQAFWLRLKDDEGWGEAAIPPYYGIQSQSMTDYWDRVAVDRRAWPDAPDAIPGWVNMDGPAPARCALDLALYDRLGKRQELPLFRLLELPKPPALPTSFTIAIDTPEEMARMAVQMSKFSALKVKLGGEGDDEARLAAIRAARPTARLRVDANAGWSFEKAVRYLERLAVYDLEMVEQPLPKEQIEEMGLLQATTPIPLVADESLQSLADVDRLAAAGVRGLNIKLMKAGGLTPALAMARRARELGLQVMLGCMVETSLGATAMSHLMGLADWVDLDAPVLISNDPFEGIQYDDEGRILAPERPGIGVIRRFVD